MSKILKFLAPVLVIVGGIGAVFTLNATAPEPEKNEEGPRPVSLFVEAVERTDMALTVSAQGEVRPKTEIDVVPQVSGQVVYVSDAFAQGSSVRAGEILIKIEPADYRVAVVQAEARVAQAALQVSLQEGAAQVARNQWDETVAGIASALALKQPQVDDAKAQLRAAEAELERAQLNLARTQISVPFDGVVLEKKVGLGQYVGLGAPLGRVYSTDTAEVRLALTDAQLARLDLPVAYQADGHNGPTVTFSAVIANQRHSWVGHIVRTSASYDAATRSIFAVAELDAPYTTGSDNGVPMPVGLYVSAEIDARTVLQAHVIPREALRSGNRVFIVTDDGKLNIREVTVAYTDIETAILSSGVNEGENVVVSSVRAPREGMAVQAIARGDNQADRKSVV